MHVHASAWQAHVRMEIGFAILHGSTNAYSQASSGRVRFVFSASS